MLIEIESLGIKASAPGVCGSQPCVQAGGCLTDLSALHSLLAEDSAAASKAGKHSRRQFKGTRAHEKRRGGASGLHSQGQACKP